MTPTPSSSLRPARLLGLVTPLAVLAGIMGLLLLPNLVMHTGLRSKANPAASLAGNETVSQSAASVEETPIMR
jgi:hypothetical protein